MTTTAYTDHYTLQAGIIKLATNAVAMIKSGEIAITREVASVPVAGDSWTPKLGGRMNATGSMVYALKKATADTAQAAVVSAITAEAQANMRLAMLAELDGAVAGNVTISCSIIPTSLAIPIVGTDQGHVEYSFSFEVDGVVTFGTTAGS